MEAPQIQNSLRLLFAFDKGYGKIFGTKTLNIFLPGVSAFLQGVLAKPGVFNVVFCAKSVVN
jgi:hypothetical protein